MSENAPSDMWPSEDSDQPAHSGSLITLTEFTLDSQRHKVSDQTAHMCRLI